MASNFRRFIGGVQLVGTATTAVSLPGEVEFLTTVNKLNLHNGTTASPMVTEAHSATLTNKILTGNTAANLVNGSGTINFNSTGTITVPNATDTLVGRATTDTLTNKTISGNTATNLVSGAGTITFNTSGTIAVPNATDTLVGRATTDTLTNKTLTAPVIATIVNTGTLTLPTSTDTLVGRATTDTLTNKTLTAPVIATIVNTGTLTLPTSTDTLVGRATTDTLTNKTINGANNTLTVRAASDITGQLPIGNGGTGQATATTGFNALSPLTTKGDIIVHNGTNNVRQGIGTDGQVLVGDSTQTNGLKWTTLQQGAKNYITYNNFENNATTGWSLSHTTLSSSVPNQASGSWTSASGSLAFTTVSSGALAGTYSGQLAWTGTTSVPGDMLVSQAYTIDLEDQAKVMAFKFYYSPTVGSSLLNFSGTSSNTYQIYIYDVANSAWIQPAGVYGMTQGSGVGYVTGTFQTPSNMTSFRIAIVCINASSSGSHTILFDDFSVGPQTAPYGPIITDWGAVPWTPTGTWSANTTYAGRWRRVGDTGEYNVQITLTGTPTGTLTVNLPAGHTIDTTKYFGDAGIQPVGTAQSIHGGTGYHFHVLYAGTTSVEVAYQKGASTTDSSALLASATAPVTWVNGDSFDINFRVPIVGWSSNVQMSSDTDTRVVAARWGNSGSTTIAASDTILPFDTKIFDTHGAWDSVNNKYVCPVAGKYRISFAVFTNSIAATATNRLEGSLQKSGVTYTTFPATYVDANRTAPVTWYGSTIVDCVAGDTLQIHTDQNFGVTTTLSGSTSQNWVEIERLSGPAVVAATETVSTKYYASGNTTSTTTTPINYDTKVFDTHNAVTTGASWNFKAPVSGRYLLTTFNNTASGTNTTFLSVYKGGAKYESITYSPNVSTNLLFGSTQIQLLAGDTIDLRCATSTVVSGNATQSNDLASHIEITRIGN
jgi:hypothetical protein